jgi:phosphoribosylformimino-5-aminoimidazole carboxamide ribotide isomerase
VQIIPSIDLEGGRSRLVFWPGASSGSGAPTDRPERIARHFVDLGASVIHLVDLDGARLGRPENLDAIGRIAAEVAVPLQLAGGIDGPEQVRLAFAVGATRVVMPQAVADRPETLRDSLAVGGDWLAVGLDLREERWREYPWQRPEPPTMPALVDELVAAGVRRLVVTHGGSEPDATVLERLTRRGDAEILVAGGVTEVAGLRRLRDAGVAGVILGQALLSGALDYGDAVRAAGVPRPAPAAGPPGAAGFRES